MDPSAQCWNRRQLLIASAAGGAWGLHALARAADSETPAGPAPAAPPKVVACDLLVYGSTPGGVAAAVEGARRGLNVVLACPKHHPGGMAASGLCTTDAVRREMFGGLVAEFVAAVLAEYRRTLGDGSPELPLVRDGWFYEPSVAERAFQKMLDGAADRLAYLRGHMLLAAQTEGNRVTSATFETPSGQILLVRARTWIDGTYEGDLAAAAGVPYRVGREARDEFGESLAGIHYMNWKTGKQIITNDTGEASPAIQAFCARSIFTDDPAKLVPIAKPDTYDEHLPDYLPLLADFASGREKGFGPGQKLPGRKFEINGWITSHTSFNCPGVSWNWPEAGRRHRARLEKFHIDHAAGFIWFLQHEARVPDNVAAMWRQRGLHRDEFADNGHWPWQIYVRQGRRIEGRMRVTQHNFIVDPNTGRTPSVEHAIAIGEHSFDIHPCHDRRFAVDGFMEGVLWYPKKAFGPAQPGQVPYGAMLPRKIDNLLVPVALSCTHVAMSVLRMEPVWMTTGQVAGLAAAMAQQQSLEVANIDPAPLPAMLKLRVNL